MRSKQILSIIAFVTAFGLSSAFALLFVGGEQNGETQKDIKYLLRQDVRNGQERFWNIKNSDDLSGKSFYEIYAESVEEYSYASGRITYSHLPRDFQLRWNEHMRAWRDYSNYLNEMKDSSQSLDEDFYHNEKEYTVNINLTYYEVLRVGSAYNVEVSEFLK